MNELIEAGDPRTKVVGNRRHLGDGIPQRTARFDRLQQQMGRLWGVLPFPRGVHRFKTHDQFETWKTTLMMRNSPARRYLRIWWTIPGRMPGPPVARASLPNTVYLALLVV